MTKLPRSTPAVIAVVAVLMLLTTTGGAVAGGLITGKKIKDNTITSADIKNGTIAKTDLSKSAMASTGATGPQGAPGAEGAPGDKGDQGDQGPRGFSAWDTIPGGVTVTGVLTYDAATNGSSATDMVVVNLPAQAPLALTATDVNFSTDASADTIDDDADCTGSVGAPTAPAGTVCIYLNGTAQMSGLNGSIQLLAAKAFRVIWSPKTTTPGQDMYFTATWAYTAPTL